MASVQFISLNICKPYTSCRKYIPMYVSNTTYTSIGLCLYQNLFTNKVIVVPITAVITAVTAVLPPSLSPYHSLLFIQRLHRALRRHLRTARS